MLEVGLDNHDAECEFEMMEEETKEASDEWGRRCFLNKI